MHHQLIYKHIVGKKLKCFKKCVRHGRLTLLTHMETILVVHKSRGAPRQSRNDTTSCLSQKVRQNYSFCHCCSLFSWTHNINRVCPTNGIYFQFGIIDNVYVTVLEELTCQSPKHNLATKRLLDGFVTTERILKIAS